MKIVLLTGQSGSGKTSIAKKLCENNERYNFVNSYTDRDLRESNEWGHTFVDSNYMDLLLERADIVAQTTIEDKRYCATYSQFDNTKINIYIVDVNGINDVISAFPQADIMTVLISRNEVEVDCVREGRNVCIPPREDVNFTIDNNFKIESAVGTLNTLINFDLFTRPSHRAQSVQNKLDYLAEQERHMREIKKSLQEQLWRLNYPMYIKMIRYITNKIQNDFDFEIRIRPDTKPEIYDGYLNFNVIGEYTDKNVDWMTCDSIVGCLSKYAHEFCKENNCKDMEYHLVVAEDYVEEFDE